MCRCHISAHRFWEELCLGIRENFFTERWSGIRWAACGSAGVPTLGVFERCGCGPEGHGAKMGLGRQLGMDPQGQRGAHVAVLGDGAPFCQPGGVKAGRGQAASCCSTGTSSHRGAGGLKFEVRPSSRWDSAGRSRPLAQHPGTQGRSSGGCMVLLHTLLQTALIPALDPKNLSKTCGGKLWA